MVWIGLGKWRGVIAVLLKLCGKIIFECCGKKLPQENYWLFLLLKENKQVTGKQNIAKPDYQ